MTDEPSQMAVVTAPSERPHRSVVAPVIGVLIVLAALAFAAWRYLYYPTTPQYALERFFEAAKARDYDKVYDLVRVPGPLRALVHNGQELKVLADRFPAAVPKVDYYRFMRSDVKGDHATIDVATITIQDGRRTFDTTPFKLVRTDGIWRIDGEWILSEIAGRGLVGPLLGAP